MMRRVDLLPSAYAERRRARQTVVAILVIGAILLLVLGAYWFLLGTQISDAEEERDAAQARNEQLQAEIDALQSFAALEAEVNAKIQALQTVMVGDIDWPKVMIEVAMVLPPEMWLTELTASAAATEGETPVGTETAPVRINSQQAFGRISFAGRSLTMPGVAKWLIAQLTRTKDFRAVYVNSAIAQEEEIGGRTVFDVDTTVELGGRALSERFQRGLE